MFLVRIEAKNKACLGPFGKLRVKHTSIPKAEELNPSSTLTELTLGQISTRAEFCPRSKTRSKNIKQYKKYQERARLG